MTANPNEIWKPRRPWPTDRLPRGCYEIPTVRGHADGTESIVEVAFSYGVKGAEWASVSFDTREEMVADAWEMAMGVHRESMVEMVGATVVWVKPMVDGAWQPDLGEWGGRVVIPRCDFFDAWELVETH